MDDVEIRYGAPVDQPAFLDVLRAIRDELGDGQAEYGALEDMAHLLCSPIGEGLRHHWLLLAEIKGSMVGFCVMHRIPVPILGGTEGYISDLFVRADARGHDVGHRLLERAEEISRVEGFLRLHVINYRERESHKREFYPKLGFQEREDTADFVLPF
ncbi:MAG: GNAT family N-acetyltransferase [Alphaproteobacteria bacterium]